MNYGIETFFKSGIEDATKENGIPTRIPVINGQTREMGQQAYVGMEVVNAEAEGDIWSKTDNVLLKDGEIVQFEYELPEKLEAPVYKGEVVGKVIYTVDGNIYLQKDIVLTEEIKKVDFKWCFEKVFDIYLGRNTQKE